MHLKRLELVGFKSFAQKTVLDFPAGIAAVVGPNGAGKSNIIDAVRWLLGEREAKNMRSIKAEDLIFAGNPQRPRVGIAQASIVFDNSSRFFPVDYAEVSIRRRIDRDGASQYFLNDAEVRLKDIIDFFAKSRLGTKGFSIINQGDSDLFVRANPKERRTMLEEILGLRQFHLKKHESELKLKSSKFNMDKARALLEELMPRLRILRRQTVRWQKHDELAQELQNLESLYFGAKLAELDKDGRVIQPKLDELSEKQNALRKELKLLQAELERVGKSEPKRGHDTSSIAKDRQSLIEERSKLERELGRLEAKIELGGSESNSAFDPAELVKLLEEVRETLEDALIVNDIKTLKKLLQMLSEKVAHILDAENEEGFQPKTIEIENSDELKNDFMAKIAGIDRKLQELYRFEAEETGELKQFKEVFSRAYQSVEIKKDEIQKIEAEKNQILFEKERLKLKHDDLGHQAEQAGKALSDFKSEENKPSLAPSELNDIERKMLRLRGELATIGEIDPGLVKEADEAEARHKFLSTQLEDLEKACGDLTALIKELELKIHDEFKKALKEINEEFQKYFRTMFGGGQAKLKLITDNSQLATDTGKDDEEEGQKDGENEELKEELGGLDIEISIPRKRITGLDMLSGGEKTLVSVAVLFALISVSPPPFLVLDEIDAALDEANTRRFAGLIKDFSKKTQFLVVTHNRATMEAADILYGITMGEDGTSKVLSLKLE